jgi:hypothetical protein
MIYGNLPLDDWKDLQNKVAQIFLDIGYETEVGKEIETVRGKVEIDVFALNRTQIPNISCLCECKYWNTPIPQTVVHSFRTIVTDYGANYGFVISKLGFQSGAYEAIKNTNVQLLNWPEFQKLFEQKWRDSMMDKLDELGMPLRDYTDPYDSLIDRKYHKLDNERKAKYRDLIEQYFRVAMMSSRLYLENLLVKEIPLQVELPMEPSEGLQKITISSEKELFDLLIQYCNQGIQEFDELFGEKVRWFSS